MSFEALMSTLLRLAKSVEALAALDAELRSRRDGRATPQIRALLRDTAAQSIRDCSTTTRRGTRKRR